MQDSTAYACEAFVRAAFEAKRQSAAQDEFYANKELDEAYRHLFKTVAKATASDVQWQMGFFPFAWVFADHIWEDDDLDIDDAIRGFTNSLQNTLDDLALIDWIACVPLERAFQKFPPYTDFGLFSIVNARSMSPATEEDLLATFRSILADHCSVNFMPDSEVQESYVRLGSHFYVKSRFYVPGRPLLVVPIGRGEASTNAELLRQRIHAIAPLLQLCQVVLESNQGTDTSASGPYSRRPDGTGLLEDGFTRIPHVCLAINKRTGQADWWNTSLTQYETPVGDGYDPDAFVDTWQKTVGPLIEANEAGFGGKLRQAIDSAIALVARCRHAEFGDATLHAVIATETILNPFGTSGDIAERFALLAAALTQSDPTGRQERYTLAKALYKERCHAVHRSRMHGSVENASHAAVEVFTECLGAILRWAIRCTKEGKRIDQDAFEELYVDSIFNR